MKIKEGYMDFLSYKTYYRIVGERNDSKPPLLLLHGGPGSGHNYFRSLDRLADSGRQIIMYDQLGSGLSKTDSRPDLWKKETWVKELISLREHLKLDELHILGQSWGGMLALIYQCDYKPKGVKSYILSSTLASASLWESEQRRRINKYLPEDMIESIKTCEAREDYEDKNYLEAVDRFMELFCCSSSYEDTDQNLRAPRPQSSLESYVSAWGQSEFAPRGSLKNYNYKDKLAHIDIPCLITSGSMDLSSPLISKQLYDGIAKSRWELFPNSRHMPFLEENQAYMDLLIEWLDYIDSL